jgi:hypothetical protein
MFNEHGTHPMTFTYWPRENDLLAEAYAWFTGGFDTADLQEAKALLEERV